MPEATQPTDNPARAQYTGEVVNIEPEWENTALWFANALAQHGFERDAYSPVVSLIEQVRYLTQTDPDAVERILNKLRARA